MNLSPVAAIGLAYHLVSRLAYVLYISIALKRQEDTACFSRRYGATEAFRRFRRTAAILMNNDAVSFVVLCFVSRGTLPLGVIDLPRAAVIVTGAALLLVGLVIKLWAAATLGAGAYYWRDFFAPEGHVVTRSAGPYRFFKNPMYTVGYLPAYGLALVTGSLPALAAALFDHAAILAFHQLVERGHVARVALDNGVDARSNQPPLR
jgi:protein-S-isoprenylcysteine O-methyltransferase Ste14